jgi:hypothetical protein
MRTGFPNLARSRTSHDVHAKPDPRDIAEVNQIVKSELERSLISVASDALDPNNHPEVFTSHQGILGDFTFNRHWRYYVASGKVPLSVASVLYEDPVGKTDIRAGGDAGCSSPETNACYYRKPTGRRVIHSKNKDGLAEILEELLAYGKQDSADRIQNFLNDHDFSDSPKDEPDVEGFVSVYHIDSEVGLRVFCDTLKSHSVV